MQQKVLVMQNYFLPRQTGIL